MNRIAPADMPALVVTVVIGLVGAATAVSAFGYSRQPAEYSNEAAALIGQLLLAATLATAAGLYRRLPAVSLTLVWVALGLHLVMSLPIAWVDLAVAIVAYGTARHGSRRVLVASALSIPAAAAVVMAPYALHLGTGAVVSNRLLPDTVLAGAIASIGGWSVSGFALLGTTLVLSILIVPWAVGLVLRAIDRNRRTQVRAETAEVAADQSRELARVRHEQAQLARDVHDVVGHSLAVILAQAESGEYLADDPEPLKRTLADIATAARGSLRDVRGILGRPPQDGPESATDTAPEPTVQIPTDLDQLIEDVRSAGVVRLESAVEGTSRPLPPEQATVAHRVLQEALTNAIKHGRGDVAVQVNRVWAHGGLTIEVTNATDTSPTDSGRDGHGLLNMRRRLESVGGTLGVAHVPGRHTILAWLPSTGGHW